MQDKLCMVKLATKGMKIYKGYKLHFFHSYRIIGFYRHGETRGETYGINQGKKS